MKRKLFLLLIAVALFTLPKVSFGQAISLGTAANFVIYTTGGSVHDNASAHSHLTGDVGYFTSGDFLGFGNIDGVMHPGVDPATTACEFDLQSAVAQLNSTSNDYFPGLLLGNGVVFTPGVYSIPGNATLNLDLVLDAQNVPNVDFIIKIAGSFSTNAGAKVKLINGAEACHVFWLVDGVISMATNTTMRGTVIANNAAISMATGDTLEGRLLSTTGAITLDGIVAYMPIGCGSPVLTGPPIPDLATIACYTIFSSIGALDGSSSSTSIGDVGNAGGGTITGWTAGNVTGVLHPTGDPSTMQAAIDLLNLYNTLDAMIPDIELLYPAEFGFNLVLTPHVYLMNGSTTFTDSIYLDAQGNPDAVFVIKIIGATCDLTTSVNSRVKLINGAQAQNVFWVVKGPVTINDNSIFRGTIVVPAGAINLWYTGVALDGRALTVNGAITTAGMAAAMPPGCGLGCAPEIITEPMDQLACAGDSVSFSIVATGPGLTYQWRKGTLNIVDGGNISGALTDVLTFDPVSVLDISSDYNVIVIGSCIPNDTSINAALLVDSAIIITSQPVSQTACVGDSISFVVEATGSGLTYQWRKGLIVLLGETSDTLTINPVNLTDAALDYNVIITGTCSIDTSINVALLVDSAIIITSQPLSQTACVGDSISLVVVATGSGLTYQWRKGLIPIVNGGNISGADSATLVINPAGITDTSSFYNVIISGSCGPNDTSINVSMMVDSSIMIISQPMDQSVCLGDSASFTVVASGAGLTYQWRKGLIPLVNGGNISGADSATLIIYPAGFSDSSSLYNVLISGSCGANDSSVYVSLEVNSAPIIITQPIDQIVCVGDSVSFVVVATGSGLTYQWRKGLIPLVNGGNISGADSDTLTINPATVLDISTNYNVVVSGVCIALDSVSVHLSSADGFGILAGTAITSTGFTEIHDLDVGLSPGVHSSIVGFPPAIVVNGAIYASDDVAPPGVAAMLIQAKQDLTDAYLYAEGATAPAPATIAGDQGGKTLTPGIYKTTSTLLIQSGDLILDAQGDINAEWIFQIASDFTTIGGAGGNVILIGGAQASNITWQVGSSATIGNYTSFSGNILALTSITMNTGSSIDGRLLARNGAVVMSGANIINGPSDSVSTVISQSISVNVSLMVDTGVTIITQPVSQVVCEGDSVSFFVDVTGEVVSYQWRKGIIDIPGETNDTLTINPANLTDVAFDYNVVVIGMCSNDTSMMAFLTIDSGILITTQPVSQIVCEGDSVSFFVVATGAGLTYQWMNGFVPIVGETNDTLTINPVNLSDAALDYNVVITGMCSLDTSLIVSLTIDSAVNITTQPLSQIVCLGDSVSFTVVATGSGLTYQWMNGIVPIIGETNDTFTINPVNLSDASQNYNVIVSGSCSSDTSINVALLIDSTINIILQPLSQTACVGDSINFVVVATGSSLTYQWRKGLLVLVGETSDTLTINPVALTDAALDYNVIITGSCANDTSIDASLTVNPIPLAIASSNSPVCTDSSILLSAQAVSGGTYSWTGPNGYLSSAQNPVIVAATAIDAGVYSLLVSANACTSTYSNVTVVVINCDVDLSVVKTVDNTYPYVGQSVVFTIEATNNGPGDATGVTVSEMLQSGYTYISSTTTMGTFDPSSGIWDIGSLNAGVTVSLTIVATVNSEGNYVNTVTISGNEIDVYSINDVSVIETFPLNFFVPEGFSPNGDGINDVLVIRGIENFPENSITIFNRWGDKVFIASPYQNSWDGMCTRGVAVGSEELPVGTYFYLLDLHNNTDIYKGTIYLNR